MKKLLITFTLFLIPYSLHAECYADHKKPLKDWNLQEITKERSAYIWGMENPDSVQCYYKLLKLEAEVAILKEQYSIASDAAESILGMSPGDYSGLLFMHLSLKAQGKDIPEWYSTKRYPNEYTKEIFLKRLSNGIIINTANKALK